VDQVADQHPEQDFAQEVDQVPLAAVTPAHCLLQVDRQAEVDGVVPQTGDGLLGNVEEEDFVGPLGVLPGPLGEETAKGSYP